MIIVFVEDSYLQKTDGTAMSTHRFREELIKRGHTVRVIATGVEGPDMYGLKEHFIPIASRVARKNNIYFAKFDKKIVTEALTGADIVHLIFPFQLERKTLKLARKMGIPVCGAFHCQPENVTYNMKLKLLRFINPILYLLFRFWLYRNLDNIHCPSVFAAGELKKHKYNARLHVISNGILNAFKPPEAPVPKEDDKIHILMTGRLAEEKRQDLVIKAANCSKYRDKIQLHFVGRGPMYKRYLRQGADLPNLPRFYIDFISQEDLVRLIYKIDLYVHASEAELESLACMEALSCGKVPVISDAPKSAASQFALDERCLFKKGRYLDLRDKMDYWIEHPEERKSMEKEYIKLGEVYNIKHSVKKMEKMFEDAIRDSKTRKMIQKDKSIRLYNNRVKRNNYIKEFFCAFFYFIIAIPLLIIFNRCFFGLKIENKKALKKLKRSGAVTICNHVHEMDSTICAVGIPSKKLIYVSQPQNFALGVASIFVDVLGSVPSPSTPKELQSFIYTLSKYLRRGRLVHFYPEGSLIKYDDKIRAFQRGAFYLAIDAQVPVLPMKLICRKPDGLQRFFKKKPCFTLVFGEPLYPNYILHKEDAVEDMLKRAERVMQTLAV
ncbi:MAG: glycosyltransferase [Treponema sp.]|jgi:1-acyl-sn-glycerol-3-phosphate acyltransferase|nr:glycosyltransferase [Treponema sp.]